MTIKMNHESKTGLLVIVCLVVLVTLVMKVGNYKIFEKGYLLKSHLNFTDGVKVHAPVRLSGVDVGEVKAINILYGDKTQVEVSLWLNGGVKVRSDAVVSVATLGLMGEKYIEIKDGAQGAAFAKEEDVILSKDPIRMDDVLETMTKVGDEITLTSKDVRKLVNHVDETLVTNKPKINNIFENLDETSENFREFSQDIKHHPWKILAKGKEKSKDEMDASRSAKFTGKDKPEAADEIQPSASSGVTTEKKSNFSSRKS